MRVRFGYENKYGMCSVSGVVIKRYNGLSKIRQYAFDGVRYFYQPSTKGSFIQVPVDDINPAIVKDLQTTLRETDHANEVSPKPESWR